jgi:hypothetical protein
MNRPRNVHFMLDAENNVVPMNDFTAWAHWFEHFANRIVGYTEITSECKVSTVFMGVDQRFVLTVGSRDLRHREPARVRGRAADEAFDNGPPLVFETMIFGGPFDEWAWRYSSWDDAETGHKAAVRKAREALPGGVGRATP